MADFLSPPGIGGSVFTIGADCGSKGGAMYDPPSHDPGLLITGIHCFLMTAPPVVIGDTSMAVDGGFKDINFAFHTNGDQPCCPCQDNLPGARG